MRSTTSGLLLDHLGDDRLELAAVAHRRQALALDDLRRVAARRDELVEHAARAGRAVTVRGLRRASTSLASACAASTRPVGVGARAQLGYPVRDAAPRALAAVTASSK